MGFYNYRFLNKEKEIIYVGKTKQELKTRIRGHLSAGHLPKECYEEVRVVEYIEFETEADMDFMEIWFINEFKPKYNKKSLSDKRPKIKINEEFEWIYFKSINNSYIDEKINLMIESVSKYKREKNKNRMQSNRFKVYQRMASLLGEMIASEEGVQSISILGDNFKVDIKTGNFSDDE